MQCSMCMFASLWMWTPLTSGIRFPFYAGWQTHVSSVRLQQFSTLPRIILVLHWLRDERAIAILFEFVRWYTTSPFVIDMRRLLQAVAHTKIRTAQPRWHGFVLVKRLSTRRTIGMLQQPPFHAHMMIDVTAFCVRWPTYEIIFLEGRLANAAFLMFLSMFFVLIAQWRRSTFCNQCSFDHCVSIFYSWVWCSDASNDPRNNE